MNSARMLVARLWGIDRTQRKLAVRANTVCKLPPDIRSGDPIARRLPKAEIGANDFDWNFADLDFPFLTCHSEPGAGVTYGLASCPRASAGSGRPARRRPSSRKRVGLQRVPRPFPPSTPRRRSLLKHKRWMPSRRLTDSCCLPGVAVAHEGRRCGQQRSSAARSARRCHPRVKSGLQALSNSVGQDSALVVVYAQPSFQRWH